MEPIGLKDEARAQELVRGMLSNMPRAEFLDRLSRARGIMVYEVHPTYGLIRPLTAGSPTGTDLYPPNPTRADAVTWVRESLGRPGPLRDFSQCLVVLDQERLGLQARVWRDWLERGGFAQATQSGVQHILDSEFGVSWVPGSQTHFYLLEDYSP